MDSLAELLMSVAANVVGYLICRWFDRHRKGR